MLTRTPQMAIEWNQCRDDFGSDGALRDIQVVDATLLDCQLVLDFIRTSATKLDYTIDGEAAALPSKASTILALRSTATPSLLFHFGDIELATHFFGENDLEFDFRPEDIHGQPQLDQLRSFVASVGRLLGKTILVSHEGWEMSPFFTYDPKTDDTTYSPQSI